MTAQLYAERDTDIIIPAVSPSVLYTIHDTLMLCNYLNHPIFYMLRHRFC